MFFIFNFLSKGKSYSLEDIKEVYFYFYQIAKRIGWITFDFILKLITFKSQILTDNWKFYIKCLNTFPFPVNGISIEKKFLKKKLNRILSCFYTCSNLKSFEGKFVKLLESEMISIFLKLDFENYLNFLNWFLKKTFFSNDLPESFSIRCTKKILCLFHINWQWQVILKATWSQKYPNKFLR